MRMHHVKMEFTDDDWMIITEALGQHVDIMLDAFSDETDTEARVWMHDRVMQANRILLAIDERLAD